MQNTNRQFRNQLRLLHILASAVLGLFIYSPWRNSQTLFIAMSFAVFPILTLTGIWMWQGARIKKWLRRPRSRKEFSLKSPLSATNLDSINRTQ